MKQAAFNREFRLAKNFSVKHIINHSSHIKYSLCSIHGVCKSVYWLAAVALEEASFFRSAAEFPLVSLFASGESSEHSLLWNDLMPHPWVNISRMALGRFSSLTFWLAICQVPPPAFRCTASWCHRCINRARGDTPSMWSGASRRKAVLRRQGKRWHPQHVVGSKQEESCAQDNSHMLDRDVHPLHHRFSRDCQSYPTSDVICRTTSGRPVDADSWYSQSFVASAVRPLMSDFPKVRHVSTDVV